MDKKVKILTKKEIDDALYRLPGWSHVDDKVSKEYVFESFSDGIKLIDTLAPFCNQIDHHPDIHIFYKKIRFDLQRFDVGGKVTDRDIVVARKIEELYQEMYPEKE